MAVKADVFYSDGYFALDLYPDEERVRVNDLPPVAEFDPRSPLWFFWDADALERGQQEFVGLTVPDLALLDEQHYVTLQRVPLPRVDCPAANLFDAQVADVIRWAQSHYSCTNSPSTVSSGN